MAPPGAAHEVSAEAKSDALQRGGNAGERRVSEKGKKDVMQGSKLEMELLGLYGDDWQAYHARFRGGDLGMQSPSSSLMPHPSASVYPEDSAASDTAAGRQIRLDSASVHSDTFPTDVDDTAMESARIRAAKVSFSAVREREGLFAAVKWAALKFLRDNWGTLLFLLIATIALILLGTLAFDPLSWKAWLTFAITLLMLAFLVKGTIPTHVTMLAAVTALLAFTVMTPQLALVGFSNTGVATVAVLFAVAEGIQRTSLLRPIMKFILGRPKTLWTAQLRLLVPIALTSAFLNNTPVVAMLIPIILQWSRTVGLPASKLLMPMNDATILGGTVTLLGTSTNLVVVGLAEQANLVDADGKPLSFSIFGVAPLGAPCCAVGILYLLIASRFLLKDRKQGLESLVKNPREYTVALTVLESSPIVGETVQEAGLRQLEGLFLVEITRQDGTSFPAPSHDTKIRAGDIMLFAGIVETVTELYHIPGVVPATAETDKIKLERHKRRLVEVVISPSSHMVGMSVRESKFRTRYHAAIIAIHRHGEHVTEKIGDIVLRPGDTMLVECGPDFVENFGRNHNFALVSEVNNSEPPRADLLHMIIAAVLVITMIIVATVGWLDLLTTALLAMFGMVLTGCASMTQVASAVSIPVLLTIALSFGVSAALQTSGAARELANFIVDVFSFSQLGLLLGIYLGTSMLSAVITNNAAVALMFPIVADPKNGIIYTQGLNPYAALYTMMLAASSSFSTPIGYQTNLMVHGPGGYLFVDWVVFGLPLQIILCVVTVVLAYYIYPS
mmetsp:Transcript_14230/g.38153  ORF Transcript_14230/g.38153 Transcript_14230/m.38153 type:complete len:786 (-) Transcript_14230:1044-3401(-)|eukprot:CAMPEP_0185839844 /NCGR_PEP_ID=MMETSP1353-20130828/15280_1 /TAXON_ID=1077150 /ORGANISM="Erythrolobus australicus, Strain CCMP3124" /LENGTH=785 /DNA_ID=CAMNT_0028539069 /DNA_START=176 /DNA_END=2533 /DNA_ORIENTATION=+